MKPLLLAIDTTHEFGSLALARGSEIVEEVALHAPTGFAHVLYEHLGRLLERHGVKPAAIDCFATASGPGSFTGVRVGLACIKGLAEATGKPAVAISNLQALSWFGKGGTRAVLLDARRGDVYGAVYDEAFQPVAPEIVARLPVWLDSLPQGELVFVSPDFSLFDEALAAGRFADACKITAPRSVAGAIAHLAMTRFEQGEATDPAALDANYVRRSDAELFWRE